MRRVDLARGLSKVAPPFARMSSTHGAIRLRPRHSPRRETPRVRQQSQISEQDLIRTEARYATGKTLREIAWGLGVSRQRVASLFRARGRGVRLRRTTPSSTEVDEFRRRYVAGESLERVGTGLGYSAGTVRNYLLTAGVALRDSHGRAR